MDTRMIMHITLFLAEAVETKINGDIDRRTVLQCLISHGMEPISELRRIFPENNWTIVAQAKIPYGSGEKGLKIAQRIVNLGYYLSKSSNEHIGFNIPFKLAAVEKKFIRGERYISTYTACFGLCEWASNKKEV